MNAPQSLSPRERLRELLAIPDRLRTDAQWDEINELEITLASTMRIDPQQQQQHQHQQQQQRPRRNGPGMPGQPGHVKPAGGGQPGKKHRKFHKRRPKPDAP